MISPSFLRSINLKQLVDLADVQKKKLKVRFLRNIKQIIKDQNSKLKKNSDPLINRCHTKNTKRQKKQSITQYLSQSKYRSYPNLRQDQNSNQFLISNCKTRSKPKTPIVRNQIKLRQFFSQTTSNIYRKPINYAFFKEINIPHSLNLKDSQNQKTNPFQEQISNKQRINKKIDEYSRFIGLLKRKLQVSNKNYSPKVL